MVPEDKQTLIQDAQSEVAEIEAQYSSGLVTQGEKYNKVVDIWGRTNDLVARSMMEGISKETTINKEGDEEEQGGTSDGIKEEPKVLFQKKIMHLIMWP